MRGSLQDIVNATAPLPRVTIHTAKEVVTLDPARPTDTAVAGPDQRSSREGALKAVTLEAAYPLQLENEVGSIVPGKLANFTILADNPLTVPAAEIQDIAQSERR